MKMDYTLDLSLNDLHHQCLTWLSEIDLWSIEIAFFRKLIRRVSPNCENSADIQELEHFDELADYYNNRLFRELKIKITSHNNELSQLLQTEKAQDEAQFRQIQKDLSKILLTFELEFKNFKKEFLNFIEKKLI